MADKEKQIEEIAQEIRNGLFKQGQGWVVPRVAEHLYEQGYRKQGEGEWIDQFKGEFVNPIYVCSLCGKGTLLKPYINELGNMEMASALSSYCPNCGAHMKGGAE